jgi:PilZ domain-containing protein
VCGIKTNQKNDICVLCENGITLVYEELMDLRRRDKKSDLLKTVFMVETGHEKSYDRRDNSRYDFPFPVLEYNLNPSTDCRTFIGFTVNISDSGLCIKTSKLLDIGQKIIIKSLLFTISRQAVVCWVEHLDDGFYKVGLEFV